MSKTHENPGDTTCNGIIPLLFREAGNTIVTIHRKYPSRGKRYSFSIPTTTTTTCSCKKKNSFQPRAKCPCLKAAQRHGASVPQGSCIHLGSLRLSLGMCCRTAGDMDVHVHQKMGLKKQTIVYKCYYFRKHGNLNFQTSAEWSNPNLGMPENDTICIIYIYNFETKHGDMMRYGLITFGSSPRIGVGVSRFHQHYVDFSVIWWSKHA